MQERLPGDRQQPQHQADKAIAQTGLTSSLPPAVNACPPMYLSIPFQRTAHVLHCT
jgi:hypothetical protein